MCYDSNLNVNRVAEPAHISHTTATESPQRDGTMPVRTLSEQVPPSLRWCVRGRSPSMIPKLPLAFRLHTFSIKSHLLGAQWSDRALWLVVVSHLPLVTPWPSLPRHPDGSQPFGRTQPTPLNCVCSFSNKSRIHACQPNGSCHKNWNAVPTA